jgi:hypothetical protein
VRLPDGTPVLFEIYQRFSAVTGNAQRLLRALAPPLLGGLLVLLLVQAPLAWSMARRLRRGHREREALLSSAVEASSQERRRIAADLHDGVVQDLAGVAFGLAPLVERAERDGDPETAAALRDSVDHLRQGVRDLRTLLVEIHPPSVARTGLEAPLADLLSPLRAAGIATTLELDDAVAAGTRHDELLYRAAREAVAQHPVVVGDQDGDAHAGSSSSTTVPRPGQPATRSEPPACATSPSRSSSPTCPSARRRAPSAWSKPRPSSTTRSRTPPPAVPATWTSTLVGSPCWRALRTASRVAR